MATTTLLERIYGKTIALKESPEQSLSKRLKWIPLPVPAAGTDYATLTVPAHEIWRVLSINGQFTSSATAGQRRLTMAYQWTPTSGRIAFFSWPCTVSVSMIVDWTMAIGLGFNFTNDASISGGTIPHIFGPLPDFPIPGNSSISFSTQNMAASAPKDTHDGADMYLEKVVA